MAEIGRTSPQSAIRDPQAVIPHRSPFLFLDEVVELDERRILARTLADPRADYFRGHYPGNPVMPGVLISECVFQAGAFLLACRIQRAAGRTQSAERRSPRGPVLGENSAIADGTPVLTRIRDARFKRIVRPGESLDIEVVLDDELDNAYHLTGRVTVGGESVLRVSFACMLTT